MDRARSLRGLVLALALVFFGSGCGGGAPTPSATPTPGSTPLPTQTTTPTPTPTPQEAAFPVTVEAANGKVTIPERPRRIVSLSPTATEMLFAIGAGGQVVAADEYSNYPPEAPDTNLSGYQPNVEAIVGYDPDLVVISNDVNNLVASLVGLGVPVLLQPAAETLDDTYAQIEQLGAATGHGADAARLVTSMKTDIERLVASAPTFDQPPTYYHELDPTFYSATSGTFIGQLYSLVGLENIADRAQDGGPYPQLAAEFIIEADPDLIFLADTKCCGVTAATVASRPGWDRITAVRTGAVVELDDDIASRWGPRVVDFLRVVVERVRQLQPTAGLRLGPELILVGT